MLLIVGRVVFFLFCLLVAVTIHPSAAALPIALLTAALVALLAIACELLLTRLHGYKAAWMVGGAFAGLLPGTAFAYIVQLTAAPGALRSFLPLPGVLFFTYVGARVGSSLASANPVRSAPAAILQHTSPASPPKILDTSSIIDGRIADVAETGFLEGPVYIAEFILKELQAVADSLDPGKRQRGRRGLDILERMRTCPRIRIQIITEDFPSIREVDLKLIELAKKLDGCLVTNDFNLNKVAHIHDVPVMNVNDLANTLRPVVLPGERLSIAILKEGKEPNQGVGYLNDGTMVVIDHARRHIGHTVEAQVTSVLQTPSGKMIFGRLDEGSARAAENLGSIPTLSR